MRALATLENGPAFAPEGRPGRLNGGDAGLRAQVARWRAMGMSWDGVARALRRPTPDVREAFDPEWMGRSVTTLGRSGSPGLGAGIARAELETLAELAVTQRLPKDLAEIAGVGAGTMKERLRRLREAGLASRNGNGTWTATRAGREAMRKIKGESK